MFMPEAAPPEIQQFLYHAFLDTAKCYFQFFFPATDSCFELISIFPCIYTFNFDAQGRIFFAKPKKQKQNV